MREEAGGIGGRRGGYREDVPCLLRGGEGRVLECQAEGWGGGGNWNGESARALALGASAVDSEGGEVEVLWLSRGSGRRCCRRCCGFLLRRAPARDYPVLN